MPADTPNPEYFNSAGAGAAAADGPLLWAVLAVFIEFIVYQFDQCRENLSALLAPCFQRNFRSWRRRQHHQAKNRDAGDPGAIANDPDFGIEGACHTHELCRGTGVQTQAVGNQTGAPFEVAGLTLAVAVPAHEWTGGRTFTVFLPPTGCSPR